jgi:predicted transcriptional regulator
MPHPKLSKLELKILEILWNRGASSVREIQEAFPETNRPAYTTIQTTVYRLLEGKQAVKIVKRVSNANIFEAAITREETGRKLIDDVLAWFGGQPSLVMAQLVKAGKLTLKDIQQAERVLREHQKERRRK